jgi:hypothetical protein
MLKRTVVRILFFGIGFGVSYLITRPAVDGDSKIKVTTPDPVPPARERQLTFPV